MDERAIYLPPAAMRVCWGVAAEFLPSPIARQAPVARATTGPVGAPSVQRGADGVTTIQLTGMLMRSPTAEDDYFFDGTTDLNAAVAAINAAANDPTCTAVMLVVNSPGGSVDGAHETADAVYALSQKKPTATFYENVGASAALLIGSQTQSSSAYRSALIGSIGTRIQLYDVSVLFSRMGIESVPIDSGGMKSAGAVGSPITAPQREYFTGIVKSLAEGFVADVARGRKMTTDAVSKLADGKVHPASQAKALGMIDRVESFDQAMTTLRSKAKSASATRTIPAAAVTTKPAAASPAPAGESDQTLADAFGGLIKFYKNGEAKGNGSVALRLARDNAPADWRKAYERHIAAGGSINPPTRGNKHGNRR